MHAQTEATIKRALEGYQPPIFLPIKNGIPVLKPEIEVPARFKFINETLTKAGFKAILFEDKRAVYACRKSAPAHFTDHLFTLDLSPAGPRWILESYNEVLCESGKRANWRAMGVHDLHDIHDMRFFVNFFGDMR